MSLIKGLKLIEQGYNEQSWQKVKEGYELVSGEPLEYVMMGEDYTSAPTPVLETDTQKQKSSKKTTKKPIRFSKSVQKRVEESQARVDPHIKLVEGQIDTSTGSGTVKFRGNAFNPDDYEYEDTTPWLKDKIKKKIPRNRKAFKNVDVECFKCKQLYSLHPDLVSHIEDVPNICEKCSKKKK